MLDLEFSVERSGTLLNALVALAAELGKIAELVHFASGVTRKARGNVRERETFELACVDFAKRRLDGENTVVAIRAVAECHRFQKC